MVRIILCMVFLLFSCIMKTDAAGVSKLIYRLDVIPTAQPEHVQFDLLLKNEGDVPLNFLFPTSQTFEITVNDQSGKVLYVFSKGRLFLQAFQTIRIEPDIVYKRVENWNYQYNGKRIPSGEYTVNVEFRPTKLNDKPIQDRTKLFTRKKFIVPPENSAFRHVQAEGENGNYIITGESRTEKGLFFYTVENGHEVYVNETRIDRSGPEWVKFKIPILIKEEQFPKNGRLILNLYERDENGKIINHYPLILVKYN